MIRKTISSRKKFPCRAGQENVAGTWQQAVQPGGTPLERSGVHDPAGAWGEDKRPVLLLTAEDQLGEQNSRRAGKEGGGGVSGQCTTFLRNSLHSPLSTYNLSSSLICFRTHLSYYLSLFLQFFSVQLLPVLHSAHAPIVF
jgi:hypothetical protein